MKRSSGNAKTNSIDCKVEDDGQAADYKDPRPGWDGTGDAMDSVTHPESSCQAPFPG